MRTVFKRYPPPFSAPRAVIIPKGNMVVTSESSLRDRLGNLEQTKYRLVDARTLDDLYHAIFKVAYKNHIVEGIAPVYAVFLVGDGGATVDYPINLIQFPGNEEARPFNGKMPTPPVQSELIQEAMDSKKIVLPENGNDFMAVPLLNPKNMDILGVLLFSNGGEEEFTDTSIKVARAFAEYASDAIVKLMPDAQSAVLPNIPSEQLVEELLVRFILGIARRILGYKQ